ncbi:hypothetical protein K1T71_013882 [Dendrolimus kikuchii]|uniref:Uncharacterized protein n=1 Tax=Dendrolimus kikuchii TaxID=765133 RepID=A0ACC1CG93_9NEOP|nr:hypothetical protein K1T71_013882 [Dendrolimus kikuchii]
MAHIASRGESDTIQVSSEQKEIKLLLAKVAEFQFHKLHSLTLRVISDVALQADGGYCTGLLVPDSVCDPLQSGFGIYRAVWRSLIRSPTSDVTLLKSTSQMLYHAPSRTTHHYQDQSVITPTSTPNRLGSSEYTST